MKTKNNGSLPAHPCGQKWVSYDLAGNPQHYSKGVLHSGLTKREMFAALALPAVVAQHASQGEVCSEAIVARDAVAMADALLARLDGEVGDE